MAADRALIVGQAAYRWLLRRICAGRPTLERSRFRLYQALSADVRANSDADKGRTLRNPMLSYYGGQEKSRYPIRPPGHATAEGSPDPWRYRSCDRVRRGDTGGHRPASGVVDHRTFPRQLPQDVAELDVGNWIQRHRIPLPSAANAVLISISTIVVALNAQLLRRLDLAPAPLARLITAARHHTRARCAGRHGAPHGSRTSSRNGPLL